jgi:hypothetical protein
MADNAAGTGFGGVEVPFATDDIGGIQHPRFKVGFGVDGAYSDVTGANPLPTTGLTDTQLRATPVPVSGTVSTGGLTDGQLRATPVPVSSPATGFPLDVDGIVVNSLNPLPTYLSSSVDIVGTYPEDSPHTSGELGLYMLAVRNDTDASSAGNGDYTGLNTDEEGRLKTSTKPASYPDTTGSITAIQPTINVPVAGGTVTADVSRASNVMMFCTGTFAGINCTFEASLEATGDTSWFGIQAVRSNANTIETTTGVLGAAPAYAWEMSVNGLKRVRVRATARTSGTQDWRIVLGTYATEPIPASQVSATQPVSGTVTATVTGGTVVGVTPTTTNAILSSAATTNGTVAKATAGTIFGLTASNTGAAVAFVKLHNSATVTVGTTAVALTIPVPAGGIVSINWGPQGMRYATGICYSITNLSGDADTTAVALNQVKINLSYI